VNKMHWKSYALGLATVYVVVAVLSGMSMSRALRPLNGLGATYMAATWPAAMVCAATDQMCWYMPPAGSPLANAFFTFEGEAS